MSNKSFSELFGGGGAGSAGGWSFPIPSSTSITITQSGRLVIAGIGGGGGGAVGLAGLSAATGGNSAPWGRRVIEVGAGQVLAITIGAGGAKAASTNTPGGSGGSTIITLDGTTIMTCQGGEGGLVRNTAGTQDAPTPVATVIGADFWVSGQQAGSATCSASASVQTAGAAVDILRLGLGRSPNASSAGGAPGAAVGTNGGGNMPYPWMVFTDWGLMTQDPSVAISTVGIPGSGGTPTNRVAGYFAGGCGGSGATSPQSNGGIGGGGGGAAPSVALAGNGGPGFVFVSFFPAN